MLCLKKFSAEVASIWRARLGGRNFIKFSWFPSLSGFAFLLATNEFLILISLKTFRWKRLELSQIYLTIYSVICVSLFIHKPMQNFNKKLRVSKSDYSNEVRLANLLWFLILLWDFKPKTKQKFPQSLWLKCFPFEIIISSDFFLLFGAVLISVKCSPLRILFSRRVSLKYWRNKFGTSEKWEDGGGGKVNNRVDEAKTRIPFLHVVVAATEIWWHRWKFLSSTQFFLSNEQEEMFI